jgi:hypothetical protein
MGEAAQAKWIRTKAWQVRVAALAREVYYLVAECVGSVTDVDKAAVSRARKPNASPPLCRDEILLGLLELRKKYEKPSVISQRTRQARRPHAVS